MSNHPWTAEQLFHPHSTYADFLDQLCAVSAVVSGALTQKMFDVPDRLLRCHIRIWVILRDRYITSSIIY
jgi:hypothetical protein